MAAPAAICSQLTAGLLQFGHFICHSGRTVPQFWHDQMILGIVATFRPPPTVAPSPLKLHRFNFNQATRSAVVSLSRGLAGIDQIIGQPAS